MSYHSPGSSTSDGGKKTPQWSCQGENRRSGWSGRRDVRGDQTEILEKLQGNMRRKRGNQSWNRWENNTRGKQEKETKSEAGSEEMKTWGEKNLLHSKRGQTEAQRGQAISPRPPTSGHLVSSQRFFMTPDWGERGAGRGGAGHLHLPGAWMLPQLVAWINDS